MGIFGMKFCKNKRENAVNDALLKMEKMAAQMAAVAGNTVTTDISERRIQELNSQNRNLKKGLAQQVLFFFRVINKDYNEEQGLEKEAKMLNYIWVESWSLRQAVRFALNGYDYSMIATMAVMAIKEIRYKKTH